MIGQGKWEVHCSFPECNERGITNALNEAEAEEKLKAMGWRFVQIGTVIKITLRFGPSHAPMVEVTQ